MRLQQEGCPRSNDGVCASNTRLNPPIVGPETIFYIVVT